MSTLATEWFSHATVEVNKYTLTSRPCTSLLHVGIAQELFAVSLSSHSLAYQDHLILSTRLKYQTNHAFPLPHRLGGRGQHGLRQPYGNQAQSRSPKQKPQRSVSPTTRPTSSSMTTSSSARPASTFMRSELSPTTSSQTTMRT